MTRVAKPVESLSTADLSAYPVWRYVNDDQAGETLVSAVKQLPVKNLVGKVVGTRVRLANGAEVWALIANVDVDSARLTEHFLTLSIERAGSWFSLARYHDFDFTSRGPEALSQFLGLKIDQAFPIAYDIREYVQGRPRALAGAIPKEPRERLSREEIIALAVP